MNEKDMQACCQPHINTSKHEASHTQGILQTFPHGQHTIQIHRRTRFSSSSALSLFSSLTVILPLFTTALSLSLSLVLSLCLTHCACVLYYLTITGLLSGSSLSEMISFSTPSFHSVCCVTVLGSHTCYVTPAHFSAQLHTH